jgi:hypothetical protein
LLGDELENQNSIFLKLDKEVIEMLKEYELKEIVIRSKQEVDSLVKKGIDEDEIIQKVSNKYFPEEELMKQIEFYSRHNAKVGGQDKKNYLVIGIVCIIDGIRLTVLSTVKPFMKGSAIFYGLIIFGIVNLVKAYSTRGEIENM